jgi:tetratricopeptide (TPR) repeat protein
MMDCLRAAAPAYGPDSAPPEMAGALHRLGLRHLAHGRYAEAERLFHRALAIRGQDVFATHTAVAVSLQGLVALYRTRGQYAEAERLQVWLRQPIPDDQRTPVQWAAVPCAAEPC